VLGTLFIFSSFTQYCTCLCYTLNVFSKVLCKKISDDNLWSMVKHLLEGLADYQSHSSSGSCVVLNGIVKARVSTLTEQVTHHPGDKKHCIAYFIVLFLPLVRANTLLICFCVDLGCLLGKEIPNYTAIVKSASLVLKLYSYKVGCLNDFFLVSTNSHNAGRF